MPLKADSACVSTVRESPNRRARTGSERVRWVVVHGTWMVDDAAALERLCDPAAEVSSHYYIGREGAVTQLVAEADVAWHAGQSRWDGVEGVNAWSIGIEVGNAGPFGGRAPTAAQEAQITDAQWAAAEAYGEAQYGALAVLLQDILDRHGLGPEAVLGHEEVAPGRKTDPGAHFDWARLARAGVALPRPLAAPR